MTTLTTIKNARSLGLVLMRDHDKLVVEIPENQEVPPELMALLGANKEAILNFLDVEAKAPQFAEPDLTTKVRWLEKTEWTAIDLAAARMMGMLAAKKRKRKPSEGESLFPDVPKLPD